MAWVQKALAFQMNMWYHESPVKEKGFSGLWLKGTNDYDQDRFDCDPGFAGRLPDRRGTAPGGQDLRTQRRHLRRRGYLPVQEQGQELGRQAGPLDQVGSHRLRGADPGDLPGVIANRNALPQREGVFV